MAAITIVAYNGIQKRASFAAAFANASTIEKKIELFNVTNSQYPTSIQDCPTPAATNICLAPGNGQTYSYFAFNPGTPSRFVHELHSTNPPAYEVMVMDSSQFYYYSTGEITSTDEFVQYTDMAPIIDKYGLQRYQISFDIKSASTASASTVMVYLQNGTGSKYSFSTDVPVTTSYQRQTITVTPVLADNTLTQAILAFYGTYGTGNTPTIRNVQMQLAP